jgi:malonate transporter MadL subunit
VAIYGSAILAFSLVCGLLAGRLLGLACGIDANVGGVGIAMLLLILITDRISHAAPLNAATQSGILFWSAIYVPVAVALAASQNVRAAVTGGPAALLAGAGATIACMMLVPMVNRLGRGDAADDGDHRVGRADDRRPS